MRRHQVFTKLTSPPSETEDNPVDDSAAVYRRPRFTLTDRCREAVQRVTLLRAPTDRAGHRDPASGLLRSPARPIEDILVRRRHRKEAATEGSPTPKEREITGG